MTRARPRSRIARLIAVDACSAAAWLRLSLSSNTLTSKLRSPSHESAREDTQLYWGRLRESILKAKQCVADVTSTGHGRVFGRRRPMLEQGSAAEAREKP